MNSVATLFTAVIMIRHHYKFSRERQRFLQTLEELGDHKCATLPDLLKHKLVTS